MTCPRTGCSRRLSTNEVAPGYEHNADVVCTTRFLRAFDKSESNRCGVTVITINDGANLGRRYRITKTVRTQQQSSPLMKSERLYLDKILIVNAMLTRTEIAKYLVTPGMSHRLQFRHLAEILLLAHR